MERKGKVFISFVGPIGAGKSVALKKIVPNLDGNWIIIEEHLDEVLPFLTQTYKSPENAKQYNLRTQLMFFNVRVRETRKAGRKIEEGLGRFVSERTVFDDIIFWNTQKRNGMLRDNDDEIYRAFWKYWVELLEIDNMIPDLFVYLRPSDEECWKRIQERSRECENTMKMDYTKIVNEEHDKVYLRSDGMVEIPGGRKIPVIIFRDERNYKDDETVAKNYAHKIMEKLREIKKE